MPVVKVTNVTGIGLDPDVYDGQVTAIEETTGQYGPQIAIKWKIQTDGGTEERTQWAGTERTGPKSKFYGIAAALLNGGQPFPDDYEIDTDDFIGKKAQLVVGPVTDRNGKTKIDIASILPPKKAKTAAAVTAAQVDAI